jgi:hypothetical protein
MDFNLVSKNNLGVVTALLLVIILSQGRFFNFLLDTALGRAILILFILFISYTNKILGVVSVLFIIIMFNNSNFGYMEGATTMGSSMGKNMGSSTGSSMGKNMGSSMGTMNKDAVKKPATPATPATPAIKKPIAGGSEGFNLLETEREGFNKKSGTIPASKPVGSENFEPFSGSFKEPYSQY